VSDKCLKCTCLHKYEKVKVHRYNRLSEDRHKQRTHVISVNLINYNND